MQVSNVIFSLTNGTYIRRKWDLNPCLKESIHPFSLYRVNTDIDKDNISANDSEVSHPAKEPGCSYIENADKSHQPKTRSRKREKNRTQVTHRKYKIKVLPL